MDAQANTHNQGEATRRGMKRRGILAAAGAVVAGIVAKQASQPVAAVFSLQAETSNSVAAPTTLTATSGFTTTPTGVLRADASGAGAAGVDGIQGTGKGAFSGVAGFGGSADGNGVYGQGGGLFGGGVVGVASGAPNPGTPLAAGVFGTGKGPTTFSGVAGVSDNGFGVEGMSTRRSGVFGQTNAPAGSGEACIYGLGIGNSGNFAVLGDSNVLGTATGAVAVQGQNAQYGVVGKVNNAPNTIAVWGNNTSTGAGAIGIYGNATNGIGVYGTTGAAGQFGVIGQTLVDNAFGLAGIANTNNSAAFAGGTANPNSFAASFQGHVQVFDGAFDVAGLGNKHGITPHPDGSVRTFYSVESPECWVEDLGEGTLVAGKAEITLDPDFVALVHTDRYHVFITEHGGHHGLHTTAKTAGGFTVGADADLATAKGKSVAQLSGSFSWRVVAKPKTAAKVDRLAKATLAPKIDFTQVPKPPPPPPVAPTPPKKP